MLHRSIGIVGVVTFIATTCWAEEPFANLSFDDACKKAKADNKAVMIDFYTTWCGPCKILDRITWKDEKVREFLKDKTIPLKIDAEKERPLAGKYNIVAYPTIVLVRPDGKEIDRILGYVDPTEFLSQAASALAGKDSVARAKEKLSAAGENNPMERKAYARALAQKGRDKEALDEYLWCFDHGLEAGPGFSGVRHSFLLSEISQLGQSYPPAMRALKERRDAAEKRLFADAKTDTKTKGDGGGGMFGFLKSTTVDPMTQNAADFSAINRVLGETEKTLEAFDKLKDGGEGERKARQRMFRDVLDTLVEKQRYLDILESVGDVGPAIDLAIGNYKMSRQFAASKGGPASDPQLDAMMKKHVVEEGGKYYEALLGAGREERAQVAAAKLIEFDGSEPTYDILVKHALRAGKRDVAGQLVREAEQSLGREQAAGLRKLIGR